MTVWALLIEVISWGFILAGSAFVLIGAYGILKFRDFWARLHAFSVMDSGGVTILCTVNQMKQNRCAFNMP